MIFLLMMATAWADCDAPEMKLPTRAAPVLGYRVHQINHISDDPAKKAGDVEVEFAGGYTFRFSPERAGLKRPVKVVVDKALTQRLKASFKGTLGPVDGYDLDGDGKADVALFGANQFAGAISKDFGLLVTPMCL